MPLVSTPPGVASIARAYFKFSATPTDLSHAVSISPLGILAIGGITLIILAWAVCAYFASRRMVAQAKELEHRILECTIELTAQRIGVSRETVTRLLGNLKKKQLIRLDGPTLVIRDRSALEALAV